MITINTATLGILLGKADRDLEAALRQATRDCNSRLLYLAMRLGKMTPPPAGFEPVTEIELFNAYVAKLRAPEPRVTPATALTSMSPDEAARIYHERLKHP